MGFELNYALIEKLKIKFRAYCALAQSMFQSSFFICLELNPNLSTLAWILAWKLLWFCKLFSGICKGISWILWWETVEQVWTWFLIDSLQDVLMLNTDLHRSRMFSFSFKSFSKKSKTSTLLFRSVSETLLHFDILRLARLWKAKTDKIFLQVMWSFFHVGGQNFGQRFGTT